MDGGKSGKGLRKEENSKRVTGGKMEEALQM